MAMGYEKTSTALEDSSGKTRVAVQQFNPVAYSPCMQRMHCMPYKK